MREFLCAAFFAKKAAGPGFLCFAVRRGASASILAHYPLECNSGNSAMLYFFYIPRKGLWLSMLYRRIRDLREDHDLTQTEMGRILSCSQRVYSNYERGELDIPTEILRKLARYYGVTTDYLLELSDIPWPY